MKNYQQVKELGKGGFGRAILAKRKSDNFLVCIKEVRLSALGPKERDEAKREINVLKSLSHPYIVKYIEDFQENGNLYIVMDYADGGDLSQKIERQRGKLFTEKEIMRDFIQIALAIKYIHDRKILHRDLKGQNIFLMKDGTIKLGDFGIARVLEKTCDLCKTQIGTPFYLSPEICQGKNYNSKTDIWSLGCILYELCTLKHAFEAGNMNALLMNIVRNKYKPIPATYSSDLRNLVDSMLTKEPERRPTINKILSIPFIKDQLNNFLSETLLSYEMQHTILHGRKPFAIPTILPEHIKEDVNNPHDNKLPVPTALEKLKGGEDEQKRLEEIKRRQQEYEEQQRRRREAGEADRENDERNRFLMDNKERVQGGVAPSYNDPNVKNQNLLQKELDKIRAGEMYNKQFDRRGQNDPMMLPSPAYQYQQKDPYFRKEFVGRDKLLDDGKLGDEMKKYYEDQRRAADANKNRGNNIIDVFKDNRNDQYNDQYRRFDLKKDYDPLADERRRIWEEQRRAAEANKNRNKDDMRGNQAREALFQGYLEAPAPKLDKAYAEFLYNEQRRKIAEDQRREAAMNRNRNLDDLRGDAMRNALFQGYADPYSGLSPKKNGEIDADYRKKMLDEQRKEAAANRNRNLDEMRGNAARDALYQGYDNPYEGLPKRKVNDISEEDRRRIVEQQRREAAANRDRHREDMKGNNMKDALFHGDDRYEKPVARGNIELSEEDRRRIWDEQKREARANKERLKNLEMGGGAAADAIREAYAEDKDDQVKDDRIAKYEISEEDRRRIWDEQKREARANKERLKNLEMGGGAAADAIREAYAEDKDDQVKDDRIAKHEIDEDERVKIMNEQRRAARANKQRLQEVEYGLELRENTPVPDPVRSPQKKKEMSPEELNEYMRQQRHEARANRARLEQERQDRIDMDKLVHDAINGNDAMGIAKSTSNSPINPQPHEIDDKDNRPSSTPQRKKVMTPEELNEYMRQQRHEARANRARLEQEWQGKVDMDKLVHDALNGQNADKVESNEGRLDEDRTESVRQDDGLLQKEKEHVITDEERRMVYDEHRAAKKAAAERIEQDRAELEALNAMNNIPAKNKKLPRFLQRLQKKSDDGSSEPSSAKSVSKSPGSKKRRTSSSSPYEEKKKRYPSKDSKSAKQILSLEENDDKIGGPNINLSETLNPRSLHEFVKSKSLALEELGIKEGDDDEPLVKNNGDNEPVVDDINNPTQKTDDQARMFDLEDRVKVIEETLNMRDDEYIDDEVFESGTNEGPGDSFNLGDIALNIPIGKNSDPIAYRAEAIRAFLEKELGYNKVLDIKKKMSNADDEVNIREFFGDTDPNLLLLAHHLLILDDNIYL